MAYDISFVNGIARSKESELLGKDVLSGLIQAPDYLSCVKILKDKNYGSGAKDDTAEEITAQEKDKLFSFIKTYSSSDELLDFFLIKNDFFNAEVLLRQKYLNGSLTVPFAVGRYGEKELDEILKGKDGKNEIYLSYKSAEELFKKGVATGKDISFEFIKGYYSYLLKSVKDKILRRIVKRQIDCQNIFACLRSADGETDVQYLQGGELVKGDFAVIKTLDENKIFSRFTGKDVLDVLTVAVKEKKGNKPLIQAEKMLKEYPLKSTESVKYEATGQIPFIMYALKKYRETEKVKTILICKSAGLTPDKIRERITL